MRSETLKNCLICRGCLQRWLLIAISATLVEKFCTLFKIRTIGTSQTTLMTRPLPITSFPRFQTSIQQFLLENRLNHPSRLTRAIFTRPGSLRLSIRRTTSQFRLSSIGIQTLYLSSRTWLSKYMTSA
jgi:hypothetical protein